MTGSPLPLLTASPPLPLLDIASKLLSSLALSFLFDALLPLSVL